MLWLYNNLTSHPWKINCGGREVGPVIPAVGKTNSSVEGKEDDAGTPQRCMNLKWCSERDVWSCGIGRTSDVREGRECIKGTTERSWRQWKHNWQRKWNRQLKLNCPCKLVMTGFRYFSSDGYSSVMCDKLRGNQKLFLSRQILRAGYIASSVNCDFLLAKKKKMNKYKSRTQWTYKH